MSAPNDDSSRPPAPELRGLSARECATNIEKWANSLIWNTHQDKWLRAKEGRLTEAFFSAQKEVTDFMEALPKTYKTADARTAVVNAELRDLAQALDNEMQKVED